MSEIKLLPCPFCGGKAELQKGMCELDNYVMCLECRSKTKLYNTKESAIKKWNTRKPMQEIVKKLEKKINNRLYDPNWNAGIIASISVVESVGGLNG